MVEINIPNSWISNALKVGGVLVVLVMVATLIKPSITGNVVNRMNELTVNLTECSESLYTAQEELAANELMINNLQIDIGDISDQNNDCQTKYEAVRVIDSQKTDELADLHSAFDTLDRKYADVLEKVNRSDSEYKELAEFAARVKCCIWPFEEESYDLEDNAVTCRTGSKGEFALDCEI